VGVGRIASIGSFRVGVRCTLKSMVLGRYVKWGLPYF